MRSFLALTSLLFTVATSSVAAQRAVPGSAGGDRVTSSTRPRNALPGSPVLTFAPTAAGESQTVDLIVQFRDGSELATSAAAPTMRREAMRARIHDFQADLARIESAAAARRMTPMAAARQGEERARIAHTYTAALYGASVRGVSRDTRADIERLPYVASVHIDQKMTMYGTFDAAALANASRRVRGTAAGTGAGIVVAVIDTGIDYTHPALGGGLGASFKVIGGWDFANDDNDPMDDNGHGTHVAGIIAGDGAGLTGVAPGASLLAFKVLNGAGSTTRSLVIAAIERTLDPNGDGDPSDRPDVVNVSLGGPADSIDDPVAKAVENAVAAGMVFTIASGNTGAYGNVPTPAIARTAITVGASDATDKIAAFSTRGPAFDYGIKPEVVAPGVDIVSAYPGSRLQAASGTSMAAPFVAGIAARLRAQHPEWTPADVKAAIIMTTDALAEDIMTAGAGRVDVENAAQAATLASPAVVAFGQADSKQAVWQTSRTITLRNVSAAPQTLNATVANLPAGVAIRTEPSSVTLAAGETQSVTIELTVTNSAVPAPATGSRSYGGQITWTGGAVPVHLPWAFVKAAFVTVDATDGDEFYAVTVIVTGPGHFGAASLSQERSRLFAPLGKSDVIAVFQQQSKLLTHVQEQVTIEGEPVVLTSSTSAQHSIKADVSDERGRRLHSGERDCRGIVLLAFPDGGKVGYYQDEFSDVAFSTLSSRVANYGVTYCADAPSNAFYGVTHEPIRGLDADVTITGQPEWFRQDVTFTPETNDPRAVTEAIALMRFGDGDHHYLAGAGFSQLMHGTSSSLAAYFAPARSAEVDMVVALERWGRCSSAEFADGVSCPFVTDAYLYVSRESVAVEWDIFANISPMAYRFPVGTPLTFGTGPLWPYVRFATGAGLWSVVAEYRAAFGERLPLESSRSHLALYDAAGRLLGEGFGAASKPETLPPGRYRIESVSPKTAYTGEVDTSKSDALIPVFTGLRLVDGDGRAVSSVKPGAKAELHFSAADQVLGTVAMIDRVPIREEITRVEYRPHGTQAWRLLAPVVAGRQYANNGFLSGGVGTVYRVDLSTVTRELTGPVDLRITIEDAAGNTAQTRLLPAFHVGGSGRRRSVSH